MKAGFKSVIPQQMQYFWNPQDPVSANNFVAIAPFLKLKSVTSPSDWCGFSDGLPCRC